MKTIYNHRKWIVSIYLIMLTVLTLNVRLYGGTISGTFTTLTACPQTLSAMCLDPVNGVFYAVGDQSSNAFYKYTISTSTWTALANAPVNTGNNAGATYLNGKIYIAYTTKQDIQIYTVSSNTWTTLTGPTDGVYTGNISNDGTNIYISNNAHFWKYVISSGSWVELANNGTDGDNKWGGLSYSNGYFYHSWGDGQTKFDRYRVATDVWENLSDVPEGAVLGAAIFDAYYYCMGDYDGSNLYSYDLGEKEWNNTLTLPWSIDDATICVYGTSLYIIQGEAGTGFTKFTPNNPMLTNIEGTAIPYTLGDPSVTVTSSLVASQNTGTNFESATVTIATGFQAGKDVLSFENAYGITGSFNAATGVLTLTGTTTIANYQSALRTVKYQNSDLTSNNTIRMISFKVFDGSMYSNTASRNVVIPGPPTVTTAAISAISGSSATSGGAVTEDGSSTVTARGVCWNTTGAPVATDSHTTDGSGLGSFTSSLTGLTIGNTYYVRAYATNALGTNYGAELNFIAGLCAPGASTSACAYMYITNVTTTGGVTNFNNTTTCAATSYTNYSATQSVSQVHGGSVTMSFTSYGYALNYAVWVDFNNDGTLTSDEKVISKSNSSATTTASFIVPAGATTGSHRMRVMGEYDGYPIPDNPCATLDYGETEDYAFEVIAPSPTVTTQAASSITTISAIGNGNITATNGVNPTLRGIIHWLYNNTDQILADANVTNVSETGSPDFSTGAFTRSLAGLAVNTHYNARAYATNTQGTGYGSRIDFWTLANVPNAPTVNNPSASTLDVAVNANSNPSGTEFAIHETATGNFIQANGTLGATAVWQTTATWGTITVTGLTAGTTYTFEVKARNGGNTETAYGATASGTPVASPVVTTQAASSVTTTTATGNGNITSTSGISPTVRGIIHWMYNNTDQIITDAIVTNVSENGSPDFTTGAFTGSLSGLSVNTRYNARAYATNSNGTGYGARVDFWTLANVPDAPTVDNPTATTLDVEVNVNGNPTGSEFAIHETSTGKFIQADGTLGVAAVWQTAAAWGTKTVTGLTTGSTYTFEVKARNGGNTETAYGATASGTPVASPVVTTQAASSVTTTTATGNGNITATNGVAPTVRGIIHWPYNNTDQIITDAIVTNVSENGSPYFTTGTFTRSLSGLSVNTRYNARAYATNSIGTGYGVRVDFWTLADVPDAPTVDNPTATTLDVEVNVNGNPTGTEFAIHETSTGKFIQADGTLGVAAVWQTAAAWGTKTVTGLTTGSTYTFEVKARNGGNTETAYGATASGTPVASPVVTTQAASSVTTTTATGNGNITSTSGISPTVRGIIHWPYNNTDQIITDAIVTNVSENGSPDFGTGTFTLSLPDLSVNTHYNARAYATNSIGTGYGVRVDFWTLANVPDAPTVDNPTATTLDVEVNVNGNPTGSEFAIHETTTDKFIQANGTLGASTVWQTASTWGTITVTGLTTGSTYTFEVKARNNANIETAYGPGTSQSTCSNPTNGGLIAIDQTICSGTTPDPFTSISVASNYAGTLEYKWQVSTISNLSGFTDISSSNSETYSPGVLTQTSWYKRLARVSCKTDWIGASESNVVKITVDPVSVGGSIAGGVNVCYGTNSTLLTLSGHTGSVIKWQKSTDNWGTSVDVANTSISLIATDLNITTLYRAVVQSGVCSTINSSDATIEVNPLGQVNQPDDIVACNGSLTAEVPFSTANTGGATTYSWTNDTPGIGLAASGTGNIASFTAVNNGTSPVVATIIVTPTYTNGGVGCSGASKSFTITVNPTGQVNQPGNQLVCNNSSTAILEFGTINSGGTTTYSWINDTPGIGLALSGNGNIASFTAVNTGTSPVVSTIIVTPTFTNGGVGCAGATQSSTITVNPTGQVNQPENQSVCHNSSTVTLEFGTINTGGTTTYTWTNDTPGIGLAASGTGNIASFTAVNAGTTPVVATIVVTPTFTNGAVGCAGATRSFTITVNPLPVPTISGLTTICAGSAGISYTTELSMSAYNWTLSSGGTITSGNGTNEIMVNWNDYGTQTVSVIYTNENGCQAAVPSTVTVTVNPAPAPGITGLSELCAGTTGVTYFTEAGFTNYVWIISYGGIITAGLNTNEITVDWGIAGQRYIAVNYANDYGCYATQPVYHSITVLSVPVPIISGDDMVCEGSTGATYTTQPNYTGYTWSVSSGGTITSGAGTNSIAVTWNTSGNHSVSVNYTNELGCDAIVPSVFGVVVTPRPLTPVITQYGDTLVSSANSGNQWYLNGVEIPGATENKHIAVYTGHYSVVVTIDGCSSVASNSILVLPVSITDVNWDNTFEIYPNPNNGRFDIKALTKQQIECTLEIYNNLGSLILKQENVIFDGSLIKHIDLSGVTPGTYMVIIRNNNNRVMKKVSITR